MTTMMMKKKKKRIEIDSDRISDLPDSLLLHLLSFLPMEDVVKTCILSKRWQYLWTSVSTLLFCIKNHGEEDIRKFVASVYKTLIMRRGFNIRKFAVSFPYTDCFASDLDLWIRFAVQSNVEDLDLDLCGCALIHRYRLPQHLYTNSSLTSLSLSQCDVVPSGNINWSSLKSLSIEDSELSGDVIGKTLSGSPVLEFLLLNGLGFRGSNLLDMNSASLKNLVIEACWSDCDESLLKISAPNLQSLHVLSDITAIKLQLIDVSSLLNAKLDFCVNTGDDITGNICPEQKANHIGQLLASLQHVKEVELGVRCIQAMSLLEVKGVPSPLSTCKCLTLETYVDIIDIPGIASLLQSSPNLETLVLNITYNCEPMFQILYSYNFDGENYWTSEKRIFKCLLMHLKTVKIVGFMGGCEKFIIALVQFLLGNTRVLEKMVISLGRSHCNKCSTCCMSPEFSKLAKKLLSFPRSSPHAVIIFSE